MVKQHGVVVVSILAVPEYLVHAQKGEMASALDAETTRLRIAAKHEFSENHLP